MDHRGQLGGIDLPGTASPECLAVVRYWDRDGNVQASAVLPDNGGWGIGVERRRQLRRRPCLQALRQIRLREVRRQLPTARGRAWGTRRLRRGRSVAHGSRQVLSPCPPDVPPGEGELVEAHHAGGACSLRRLPVRGRRDWALPELDRAHGVAATADAPSPLIDARLPPRGFPVLRPSARRGQAGRPFGDQARQADLARLVRRLLPTLQGVTLPA